MDEPGPACVDAHLFTQSFVAYLRARSELTCLRGLGLSDSSDPFNSCPVCSKAANGGHTKDQVQGLGTATSAQFRAQQPASTQVRAQLCAALCCAGDPSTTADNDPILKYRPSISADVVTKLSHYQQAAKATSHLKPQLSIHYGPANAEVQERHSKGELNLKHLTGAGDEGSGHACQASLTCARTDSKATGGKDIHGVFGMVCQHNFSVKQGFIDLTKPENFSIYLVGLEHILLLAEGRIRDVYIDFACQFRATWDRFLACKFKGRETPRCYTDARLIVNFLHAAGHTMACQLKNSGRFTEQAGWRVGEQTEQLWSRTKVSHVTG